MPANETPSLSPANERFFKRGKKLWYEYTHRPEPLQPTAHDDYLDQLSEDERLALTYAQRSMRTSGPVDLEDGDDDEEVRYRLAERIRRGTEFWDSLPEDEASRRASLRTVDQKGDLQRDMDWASMWRINGGSDATRQATLPSILSTRSTLTTPVSAMTRGTEGYGTDTTLPDPSSTPKTLESPATLRSDIATSRPDDTPVTPITPASAPVTPATGDTAADNGLTSPRSTDTSKTRKTHRSISTGMSSTTARSSNKAGSARRPSRFACC